MMPQSVTHHPGLPVTYLAGSYRAAQAHSGPRRSAAGRSYRRTGGPASWDWRRTSAQAPEQLGEPGRIGAHGNFEDSTAGEVDLHRGRRGILGGKGGLNQRLRHVGERDGFARLPHLPSPDRDPGRTPPGSSRSFQTTAPTRRAPQASCSTAPAHSALGMFPSPILSAPRLHDYPVARVSLTVYLLPISPVRTRSSELKITPNHCPRN